MKKGLILLFSVLFLVGCGDTDIESETGVAETEEEEKREEMLETEVMLYLSKMTNNYSSAFIATTSIDEKNEYLTKAITDINLAVLEIEDEFEEGAPPTKELFELAELLKIAIESEIAGDNENAHKYSHEAGAIIGDLSREYLDGELPTALKIMTGLDDAN